MAPDPPSRGRSGGQATTSRASPQDRWRGRSLAVGLPPICACAVWLLAHGPEAPLLDTLHSLGDALGFVGRGNPAYPLGSARRLDEACYTILGEKCVFPFNFTANDGTSRMHTTCAKLDDDKVAQCATKTDENGSVVDAALGECQQSDACEIESDNSSDGNGTIIPVDAASAVGANKNSEKDVWATVVAVMLYGGLACGYFVVFLGLRMAFPVMFAYYATKRAPQEECVPTKPPWTVFGWVRPVSEIPKMKDLWKYVGLDQAMLLEMPELCLRITVSIAVPMLVIMVPINRFLGGGDDATDEFSRLGTGNIAPRSMVFWVHSLVVWVVVVLSCYWINKAEEEFVVRRFAWLRWLPEPRATTLLVENIPQAHRSDERLYEFYAKAFGKEQVVSAVTVKSIHHLQSLVAQSKEIKDKLKSATYKNKKNEEREVVETSSGTVDAVMMLEQKQAELQATIETERMKVAEQAKQVCGINTSSGFVTFSTQRDTATAAMARLTKYTDEFVMSHPPDPIEVEWDHLAKAIRRQRVFDFLGYVFIFLIFWGFLATIGTILAGIAWVQNNVPENMKWLIPVIDAIGPTFIFQQLVGWLPSLFIVIFKSCFVTPSEPYVQQLVYTWYFWFLYVFVLLVAVIGTDPVAFGRSVADKPTSIFTTLAKSLPSVSNYYINLVILQTSMHFLNMTRYVPALKFLIARAMYDVTDAKKLAEPEDQDYYGLGSRSARWTNTMLIGIVFCQIQPLILVVVAVHFLACKFVYGYLVVYAEDRKSDEGGMVFWTQLSHLHWGLFTYIVLMTGYLWNKGPHHDISIIGLSALVPDLHPGLLSGLSGVYLAAKAKRLNNLEWRNLPWTEISSDPQPQSRRDDSLVYIQPELLPDKPDKDDEATDEDDDESDEEDDDDSEPEGCGC